MSRSDQRSSDWDRALAQGDRVTAVPTRGTAGSVQLLSGVVKTLNAPPAVFENGCKCVPRTTQTTHKGVDTGRERVLPALPEAGSL